MWLSVSVNMKPWPYDLKTPCQTCGKIFGDHYGFEPNFHCVPTGDKRMFVPVAAPVPSPVPSPQRLDEFVIAKVARQLPPYVGATAQVVVSGGHGNVGVGVRATGPQEPLYDGLTAAQCLNVYTSN